MYLTGGIGSTTDGEAFSEDYDLPNDMAYAETCASIAMVFFAKRMLNIEPDGIYADIMERELYNGTISGIQLDGKRYFYVNPLECSQVFLVRCLDIAMYSQSVPVGMSVLAVRPIWFA